MSWFKVDDKLWGHPKWLATPIRSRGLWVTAGSWCADQEQDGNVPRHVLPILGATVRDASALVTVGLWVDIDTGWRFHGWAEFQPTREQKEADRSAARERMRAARERKAALRSADVRPNIPEVRDVFGGSPEDVRSTPSRPDPSPSSKEEGTTAPRKRGARIADDFTPSQELIRFAADHGFSAAQAAAITAEFVDYWRGVAGAKGVKLDWDGTWRNWVRKQDPARVRVTNVPGTTGATWTEEQLTAVLGPDRWRAPQPPSEIPVDEQWDWVRQQLLAHRVDRIRQAIDKQQGGVA